MAMEKAVAPPHIPELEQIERVERVGGSYFAIPSGKMEPLTYNQNKGAPSITESEVNEMPSPAADGDGIFHTSSGAVGDPTNHGYPPPLLRPVELAASDGSHELPSRSGSLGVRSRMSHGPSPTLNPQAPSVLAPSDAYDMWPGTHFEPASPGPSLLSANSLILTAAGPASLVSHSRGRSSPRVGLSPPMSPLLSMDRGIDTAKDARHHPTHQSSAPNLNNTNLERSAGPSFDGGSIAAAITAAAASVGSGAIGGVAPAPTSRGGSSGPHFSGTSGRQRPASTRSQASEGTLVNSYSRSGSPAVGRHSHVNTNVSNPTTSGYGGSNDSVNDRHADTSFHNPGLVGLGFAGEREREREAAREAEEEAARREELAGSRDREVEGGSLEVAYRAATTPEPRDAEGLRDARRDAPRRTGR